MKRITRIGSFVLLGIIVLLAAGGLFLGMRQVWVKREIERQRDAILQQAPDLEATSSLEILPLYEEAVVNGDLISGHGVSYLLTTDKGSILLDVGNNPEKIKPSPLLQNMDHLGKSLDEIDALVISHAHPDHLGGVESWREGMVSIGPNIRSTSGIDIFVPVELNDPKPVISNHPTLISPGVVTTGAIPYQEVFPLNFIDPISWEQALIVNLNDRGLVLITGCGHPGLKELINRAEDLYEQKVVAVVGGLHYGDSEAPDLAGQIVFLLEKQLELVALSPHDSEAAALNAFRDAFPESFKVLEVGKPIRLY